MQLHAKDIIALVRRATGRCGWSKGARHGGAGGQTGLKWRGSPRLACIEFGSGQRNLHPFKPVKVRQIKFAIVRSPGGPS